MSQARALMILGASTAASLVVILIFVQLLMPQVLNFYNLVEKFPELAVSALLGGSVAFLLWFITKE